MKPFILFSLGWVALSAAWAGLDPATRAKARASVASTLANGPKDDGGAEAIVAMGAKLGLPPAAMRDLALYVFAILAREIITNGGT